MLKTPTEAYLFVLLGIFIIPWAIWKFGRTDSYAPLPVVQIVAGILFGPGILGQLLPGVHETLFTPETIKMMSGVAVFAVVLFVFTAGIEVDINAAWDKRKDTVLTSSLALATPLLFGSVLALFLWRSDEWVGEKAHEWQFVLAVGMATAVTALPILVLLLEKMGMLKQDIGIRCMRYASFDDIAIWTVFAVILLDWGKIIEQAIFLGAYALVVVYGRKHIKRIKKNDRFILALAWLIACSLASDRAGLHYMVGAFLAGLIIDEEWFGKQQLVALRKYVLLLLMPVFFLTTGLKTSWEIGGLSIAVVAAALFVTQASGKIVGVNIAGRILKWKKSEATTIGWLLQTKALIEIIFCTMMLEKGIITSQMFTALLLMAVASTIVTTPVVSRRLGLLKK